MVLPDADAVGMVTPHPDSHGSRRQFLSATRRTARLLLTTRDSGAE